MKCIKLLLIKVTPAENVKMYGWSLPAWNCVICLTKSVANNREEFPGTLLIKHQRFLIESKR